MLTRFGQSAIDPGHWRFRDFSRSFRVVHGSEVSTVLSPRRVGAPITSRAKQSATFRRFVNVSSRNRFPDGYERPAGTSLAGANLAGTYRRNRRNCRSAVGTSFRLACDPDHRAGMGLRACHGERPTKSPDGAQQLTLSRRTLSAAQHRANTAEDHVNNLCQLIRSLKAGTLTARAWETR